MLCYVLSGEQTQASVNSQRMEKSNVLEDIEMLFCKVIFNKILVVFGKLYLIVGQINILFKRKLYI